MHDGAGGLRPLPNKWGAQGWTSAKLSKLSAAELKSATEMAWAHAVAKPPKRKRR